MRIDKQKAKTGHWRIPERTLLLVAALGGSLGTLVGIELFWHKTRHLKFTVTVPLLLMAHVALFLFLHR